MCMCNEMCINGGIHLWRALATYQAIGTVQI